MSVQGWVHELHQNTIVIEIVLDGLDGTPR
jgi:hypothetical protein